MPLNNTAKNLMLDALGGVISHVSLHTADPGATGTSEVTGGSYARKSITWNAAATANLDSSNQPVFDVPGGTTITHAGYWSASTAGTFYGGRPLPSSEAFGADGTYTLTDVDENLSDA